MAAVTAVKSAPGAIKVMAAGWAFFTGTHLLMTHPPVRETLVNTLGDEKRYLGLFSAVAAAAFVPTTIAYVRYGRGAGIVPGWTELTRNNTAVRTLGLTTKVAAGITFSQGLATPGEIGPDSKKEGEEEKVSEPKGIYRITRHPMFTALALLGIGNILMRGYAGDIVYWGGYTLIWAVGCPHQDYRLRTTGAIPKEYFDKTSFLPFAAILEGRNNFKDAFQEFNKPVLATSIIVPLFFL